MSTTAKATIGKISAEDLQRGVQGAADALTDQMVERIAITVGNVAEIADRLNEPDTSEAVHALLDELTRLHKVGGLVSLFEVVHMINAARNATTDSIVERLAMFAEQMVTTVNVEENAYLFQAFATALTDAQKETAAQPTGGGLLSAMRLLSAPETQSSLRFLLAFAEGLQRGVK
jgi:uncharacterized protein YjgD (DUF1641 family)